MNKQNQDSTKNDNNKIQLTPELIQQLALSQKSNQLEQELNLAELWKTLWNKKWFISFVTTIFAVASVWVAVSLPNIYQSEVLLAPATEDAGDMGALASKFGGLASLAGVNLGGGGTDKTGLALEILKSRKFISNFIDDNQLLVPLMAAEDWDMETNSLLFDTDIYDVENKMWVREVVPPFNPKPSYQEAYKEFRDILQVSLDEDTGMIKVSIEYFSPEVSKDWVEKLVAAINLEVKGRDLAEAQKTIKYIEQQLIQVELADLQTVLYQIMEEQTKTIMFAQVRDEYVFKTIDPAQVPEEKVKPMRALIVLFGLFLGTAVSVIIVVIRHFLK